MSDWGKESDIDKLKLKNEKKKNKKKIIASKFQLA